MVDPGGLLAAWKSRRPDTHGELGDPFSVDVSAQCFIDSGLPGSGGVSDAGLSLFFKHFILVIISCLA